MDHRPLGLGPGRNLGVVLGQPGLHRRILPFKRTLDRPLRGEAPAAQVVAHRAQRRRDAEADPDQVAHRLAAPECPRQVELVRAMPGHELLHLAAWAASSSRLARGGDHALRLEGSGAGNPPAQA